VEELWAPTGTEEEPVPTAVPVVQGVLWGADPVPMGPEGTLTEEGETPVLLGTELEAVLYFTELLEEEAGDTEVGTEGLLELPVP